MTPSDIYFGVTRIINELIRKEHSDQGHFLTGASEASLDSKISRNASQYVLSGYALSYMKILNEGLKPDEISTKMFAGLYKYFILRGLGDQQAQKAAAATLHVWRKEGMSTVNSRTYSSTGERQHFIERAMENPRIDTFMSQSLDFAINEQYLKTKSETI